MLIYFKSALFKKEDRIMTTKEQQFEEISELVSENLILAIAELSLLEYEKKQVPPVLVGVLNFETLKIINDLKKEVDTLKKEVEALRTAHEIFATGKMEA